MAATSSFRYYPRPGWTSRVTGAKVQGSTDGSSWTDLATISSEPPSGWNVVNMSVDLTTYNYVRYLSPNSGYGNISEVEWYDGTYGSGGTLITPVSYIANYLGGGDPYTNAFDGNTSSFYEGNGGDNQYVGIYYGTSSGGQIKVNISGSPVAKPIKVGGTQAVLKYWDGSTMVPTSY